MVEPRTFNSLLIDLNIIKNNPVFPDSVRGFLLNVNNSLKRRVITDIEKDYLIGLLLSSDTINKTKTKNI